MKSNQQSRSKAPLSPKKAARRKRIIRRRIIGGVCAGLLVLLGGGILWGGWYINKALSLMKTEQVSDPGFQVPGASEPPKIVSMDPNDYNAACVSDISVKGDSSYITNYLILGLNQNLADTNILVSINTREKTIQLISILRDTAVTITRDDGSTREAKLNASHSSGGITLHRRTIEDNFRLRIDRYLTLDFGVFTYAVDQLGGVDIELNKAEAQFLLKKNKAGVYHLNGQQALTYTRDRHHTTIDGARDDFGRTERQRRMLFAIFDKAKQNPITLTSKLLNIISQANVKTTVPKDQLLDIGIKGLTDYKDYKQIARSIPTNKNVVEHWIGKSQAIALKDPVRSVLELHEWIYGKPEA